MQHLAPAYWPTRLLLAVGFDVTVITVVSALPLLFAEPCFGCFYGQVLGLPANLVKAVLAIGLATSGFAWMLRIFFQVRREDRSSWRYRDH